MCLYFASVPESSIFESHGRETGWARGKLKAERVQRSMTTGGFTCSEVDWGCSTPASERSLNYLSTPSTIRGKAPREYTAEREGVGRRFKNRGRSSLGVALRQTEDTVPLFLHFNSARVLDMADRADSCIFQAFG